MPRGIAVWQDNTAQLPLTNSGLGFASVDVISKLATGDSAASFAIARLTPDAMLALASKSGTEALRQAETRLATLTTPALNLLG